MRSSFPKFRRLIISVLILGFGSFCTINDTFANSYEATLLKAAQGVAKAQFKLTTMYFVGEDVQQNYIKAYAWSDLSAAKGHLEGEKILSKLIERMTSQQIREGKALSTQFENRISSRVKDNETTGAIRNIDIDLERHAVSSEPSYQNGSSSKEISRDGRFIAYANGTVLDTRTGLMWAASDNGEDINWRDAKKYCENYIGGWHDDWRMPTLDELALIYNTGQGYMQECCSSCGKVRITALIRLSCCCLWSSETDGYGAAHFVFRDGFHGWNLQADYVINRVLPVRNAIDY